jgi:5-methylcytosine-specific restriction endonuclease McrA
MQLPISNEIPINLLAACFNNTSATYKYYWLISILQSVEKGELRIFKKDLFARMISNAWFTVNYFHISFGQQDKLQRAIEIIKESESLAIDEKRENIFHVLTRTKNKDTLTQLNYFNNQVPHWFLSPWFPRMNKIEIYEASHLFKNQCLYSLSNDFIEINPEWRNYLQRNIRVLKDFCYWNLVMYLQAKNPNVPDIPNKLIRPAIRNNLTKQRTQFWDLVLEELGSVKCIYTGEKLTVGNYAVEHFIPYSFVSHDLIWNLIPANKSFNSSKSDKLPELEKYFNPFFDLQKEAVEIMRRLNPKNKFLEDYLSIFSDLREIKRKKFKELLQPLISIASNNGYEFLNDTAKSV